MWCVQFAVVAVVVAALLPLAQLLLLLLLRLLLLRLLLVLLRLSTFFFVNFLVSSDFLLVKMRIERLYFPLPRGWGQIGRGVCTGEGEERRPHMILFHNLMPRTFVACRELCSNYANEPEGPRLSERCFNYARSTRV